MKLYSSLLIFISSAAAISLQGVYKFQTNAKGSNGLQNEVTSDVVISLIEGKEDQYALTLKNLHIDGNLYSEYLARPFEFQTREGQIISVFADPTEKLDIKNLKKSIVESLQTSTLLETQHQISESGASGVRNVEYSTTSGEDEKYIQAKYEYNDYTEFPKNSNLQTKEISVSGRKVTQVNPATDSIVSSRSNLVLNFFNNYHKTEVKSESLISFVSENKKVEKSVSGLIQDTLIHEIDVEQHIERLRDTVGNPAEYLYKLLQNGVSREDSLKMQSKLISLAQVDEVASQMIVKEIDSRLRRSLNDDRLYFLLSRINTEESHLVLANEISKMLEEKRSAKIYTILRAVAQIKSMQLESPLMKVLQTSKFSEELQEMVELTLGSVSKHLPSEQARSILSIYENELEVTSNIVRKTHLLHVLGNAKDNTPIHILSSHLSSSHESVRSAAVFGLRYSMHQNKVQQNIYSAMKNMDADENKYMLANLIKGMKENVKEKRGSMDLIDQLLGHLKQKTPEVIEGLPQNLKKFVEDRISPVSHSTKTLSSSTSIWNDSSDPLYNFAAPLAQRQQDVERYPSYEAFINAQQYGPSRIANLKFITGVFSGSGSKGCLAGNFKIFDHLYTDTTLLGESHLLADLELFILTFGNTFDSRIYGNINGNVLVDFKITNNCSDGDLPIFDGELFLIDYYGEFPIDLGNVEVTAQAIAGLEFHLGYKICLLTLNPYVELYLTGKVELLVDLEVFITVVGLVRGGVSGDVYLNYEVGPETQIGTRLVNGTTTCQACIGVYYGYDTQEAALSLWFQRRQGLGWGERTDIPIFEWSDPAVPFPQPLIEECSDI